MTMYRVFFNYALRSHFIIQKYWKYIKKIKTFARQSRKYAETHVTRQFYRLAAPRVTFSKNKKKFLAMPMGSMVKWLDHRYTNTQILWENIGISLPIPPARNFLLAVIVVKSPITRMGTLVGTSMVCYQWYVIIW